jgi:phage terminase large subunit-like protein
MKSGQMTRLTNDTFDDKYGPFISRAYGTGLLPGWREIARPEQLRPAGFVHWLYLAGRGAGKTRSAAERIRERVESGEARYIALIGSTFADVRDVMVEGESGLRAIARDLIEKYNRSIGELVFKNGAKARFFSGEDPDALRGWQSTDIWGDELCAWKYPQATFDMAMFGLRLGEPEAIWTTTPRNLPVLKQLMKEPGCTVTRSSTFANRENLAPAFFESIVRKYENTALGRQELEGQILEDCEGALWQRAWFEQEGFRLPSALVHDGRFSFQPPEGLNRVVVGLDPSVSDPANDQDETNDACGVVVAGVDELGRGYVLADFTEVMAPGKWAQLAVRLYDLFRASTIVAEANQGGELIREVIRGVASNVPIQLVHAMLGKRARAEPVALLYEQGRIRHCGTFAELEDQMVNWDARRSPYSPNNIDALVWAFHGLGLCQANGLRTKDRWKDRG